MKLARPGAVLFDWDGTLVDSFPVIHRALNDTLTAMGLSRWGAEEARRRIGPSLRDYFPAFFGDRWLDARAIYQSSYAAHHLEALRPLPGADEVLSAFAAGGVYLGVVSNKSGHFLRREARHLGWERYFGRLVGATDAAEDKPAVAPVRLALEGSGVAPGPEVWFVGDDPVDLACARNAGCVPILLGPAARSDPLQGTPGAWRFPDCGALAALVPCLLRTISTVSTV